MKQQELINAAYEGKTTLVIKNASVVNVFTSEVIRADVAVYNDIITGVGSYSGENEYDAKGAYLCPGFIDGHVHIESSMVIPSSYMRTVMPHGTTAIVADPHEIANVLGINGIRTMYKLSDDLPLLVLFMLPSCVPSTPFENAGAELTAEDMEHYSHKGRVIGLGEVMDTVSVVNCQKDMLDKLRMFDNRPIDGHAPLLSGRALDAYRVAGPSTDHECSNFDEVLEKLRTGMKILIRVGSAAKGIEEMLEQIVAHKLPLDNMMFCTDDKHLEDIRREGHINAIARMAVKAGIAPIDAVKMASYNTARAYGIRRAGAVAPGYRCDLVLFEDLVDFKAKEVFIGGRVYEDREYPVPLIPPAAYHSMNVAELKHDSFRLPAKETMPVISIVPGQLVTKLNYRRVERDGTGAFVSGGGLNKLVVVERHHATGNIGRGIIEGLSIKNGAIAATVGHDSHNLIIAGDNDEDMLTAAHSLIECGGGYCVVSRGVVLARLPLPIAGLMTDAPVATVIEKQRSLIDAAASIGCDPESDPLILISFLALPVIPEARLTDMGFFDAVGFKFLYTSGGEDL